MDQEVKKATHKFLWNSLLFFLFLLGIILLLQSQYYPAVTVGFLLSFVFVGSNFFVIRQIKTQSSSDFLTKFYLSLGVRFLLVLAAFVMILQTIKIHQIYFTVSFIISYIFHSVIEMILINKLLETDN